MRQRARPVLLEFWDFCRPNSLRTLPYLQAAGTSATPGAGLSVIGVHSPRLPVSRARRGGARRGGAAAGSTYPVLMDTEFEVWRDYGTRAGRRATSGAPTARSFDYHYGEGAYEETRARDRGAARASTREPLAPLRPEDAPEARARAADRGSAGRVQRALRGRRRVGGARRARAGAVTAATARELAVDHPGAYLLIEHERHTAGVLDLRDRAGRDLPRHLLHARPGPESGRELCGVRSCSRRSDPRRPAVARRAPHRPASRGSPGCRTAKVPLKLQEPVLSRRAPLGAIHSVGVIAAAVRRGGCDRRSRARRRRPGARPPRPSRARPARRSSAARDVAAQRAQAGRVQRPHGEREARRPARGSRSGAARAAVAPPRRCPRAPRTLTCRGVEGARRSAPAVRPRRSRSAPTTASITSPRSQSARR